LSSHRTINQDGEGRHTNSTPWVRGFKPSS
jgi:hypothetical protein